MSYDHKWAHLFARLGYLLQTTTRQHVLTQGQRWRAPGEAYQADIPQLAPYCWCCKFPNVWSPFWTQKDLSVSLHAACDDWWSARSSLVLLQFDKWRLQSQKEKEFFFFFQKTTFVSVLLNWNYLEGQMTLKPRYNPEKQGLLLCMNLRRAIIGSSKQVIDVARNWTTCFAWNLHLLLSHYRCKCMHIFTNSNRCCCIHIISQFVQYILSCWLITG